MAMKKLIKFGWFVNEHLADPRPTGDHKGPPSLISPALALTEAN